MAVQGDSASRRSIWPSIYPRVLEMVARALLDDRVRQQPAPGRAARAAAQRPRRGGGRALAPRLAVARGAHRDRGGAEVRAAASAWSRPARSSSASTWAPSTWSCRSSRRSRSRAGCSASVAPATRCRRCPKGRIFPKFRADLVECAVVTKLMRERAIEATAIPRSPLDVLAQQIVAMVAVEDWTVDDVHRVVTSRAPVPGPVGAPSSRTCSTCSTAAIRPRSSPSCGRAWCGTGSRARCARAAARRSSPSRTPARSPTAACTACTCPTAAAWASSTRRWSTRRAPARPSGSAPRPGGSRRSRATA